jgi:hypothetical protein
MTLMLQSGLFPDRRYSNMDVLTSHPGKAACTAPAPCRDSIPGEVTCFHFELELSPAESTLITKAEKLDRLCRLAALYRVRALVVDDVEDNREVLSGLLERAGVEVTMANSGA